MDGTLTTLFSAGPLRSGDVLGFRIARKMGRMADAEIEIRVSSSLDPDEILGCPARLELGREEPEHAFDGVVMGVTLVASPEDDGREHRACRIHVSSLLGLLAQEVDCRIFQDKDVKEIVAQILRDRGIGEDRQSWRLVDSYPKREYCVQYNESALDFVSRLLEEEGIHFCSESADGGEVIVFTDDSTGSDPIDGDSKIPYRHDAGLSAAAEVVGVITERHRTAPGKVILRDYDFTHPQADLTATAAAAQGAELEIYDYPGLYAKPAEGVRLAQVRLEALQAERATLDIRSGSPRIVPGRWLELVDAPHGLDGKYVVTAAVHELRAGVLTTHATLIPKGVKFRTPRLTPAPVIDGPQTATVVAPPGAPAEEIHTDEHGRCKVKFHWDRYGRNDDMASCWMRVAQPQTSGSMVLPRVGWEVIVEFLDGNPDRPIVSGRVYNGRWMPPYALPEGKSRTAIQTASSPGGGGMNEIRFEDKAGSEEIRISAHKDTTLATANNKKKTVGANETKNVKVDSELSVGGDQTIKVTSGYLNTVVSAQEVSVSGSRKVEVNAVYGLTSKGASETSVGGNQMEMDGNPIQALLALAVKAATEAVQAEAARQLQNLDQAVSDRVQQALGPIQDLQNQVAEVGAGLDAVGNGNLGAAAGTLRAAGGLPTPGGFGASLARSSGGGSESGPLSALPGFGGSATGLLGIDSMVHGAIQAGGDRLGEALGLGGGGGGGSSAANTAGPDGAVAGNSAADSTTGPGYSVNICSATHTESVGGIKATLAADGIHTTMNGARTQKVDMAHVELVGGTRVETCLAGKTEKALGLAVISGSPESEEVGGSRTTMVGGGILEKIGGSHTVTATGKAMFVGAFHKIDASSAIVLKCGDSEVVIDGGGVAIKALAVTLSAPKITLTKSVSES